MDIFINLLITIIIYFIGYGIHNIYNKDLNGLDGFMIGLVTSYVILMIVGNKNSFKIKNKNMFGSFALVLTLSGGSLWCSGEWCIYKGKDNNPLLAPIGSLTTAVGGIMALIIYLQK